MTTRLKNLSRGSQAALTAGAGSYADAVKGVLRDFLNDPSARHYRDVEEALLEYQAAFLRFEEKSLEVRVAEERTKR
jgi:hypothetical protein